MQQGTRTQAPLYLGINDVAAIACVAAVLTIAGDVSGSRLDPPESGVLAAAIQP